MANTWRAVTLACAYASAKSMIDIFTTDASAVLRAYRMFHLNNGTSAVTGVLTTMRVNRLTTGAPTGGSAITPIAHDTSNGSLEPGTTSGTGRTPTRAATPFRQYLWSNDEPTVSGATLDEWEILIPFAQVWDAGYGDSNVQPLVCRQNQGVEIQQSGSSAVGTADFEIEFTDT